MSGHIRRPASVRRLVLLLVVVAALAVTPAVLAAGTAKRPAAASAKQVRLGLVLTDLTVSTIHDIYTGAQQRAKQVGGVTILEGGSSQTVDWLKACERIVHSHIDVLAYSTLDAKGTRSCIKDADSMGLPIICVLPCTPIGKHNVRFIIDFHRNGVAIGTWMGKSLHGKGQVGIIVGAPGDQAAAQLVKGFKDGLRKTCPACKVVAEAPGGFNRSMAYNSALSVLTAHPGINGIYSLNDDGALGALRAIKQQGKLGTILLAGHNGACDALNNILHDQGLGFTVLFAGAPFGIATVDIAKKVAGGQKVPLLVTNIKNSIPIDHATALAYLNGKRANPPGVDVRGLLHKIDKKGC